jgi:hypothetical protein
VDKDEVRCAMRVVGLRGDGWRGNGGRG